jgi:hypothetical protein
MEPFRDVIARHEIGESTKSHGLVEELLRRVIEDAPPPAAGSPVVGLPDIDFHRLRTAARRMRLADEAKVAAVAGPEAAESLRAFRAALDSPADVYGLLSGPKRTQEQADAIRDALREAASEALGHFMAYWRAVGGIDTPPLSAYVAAIGDRRLDATPRTQAAPSSRSPIPHIRIALDGAETALLARKTLGRAFASSAHALLGLRMREDAMAGMLALSEFSEISPDIRYPANALSRRRAHVDRDIAEECVEAADEVEAFYERLEGSLAEGGVPTSALPGLREAGTALVRSLGVRIGRVERLSALRGYDLSHAAPAPSPGM